MKPRVLFITRRFPPSVGGMENFAYDLSGALSQKTKLYLIKWGGSNRYLPVLLIPYFFIRACWILMTQKVDIIHMQDGVFSIWGVALKFIFRKPMTVVIHGLDITHPNRLYQFLVPRALKRSDHIFCISHMTVDEVVKRGVPSSHISFIPIGMTDDNNLPNKAELARKIRQDLKLPDQTKIILSTGRLIQRKGVAWFVDKVMPELVKTDEAIVLVVSGQGPEEVTIKAAIKKHGLEDRVLLLGRTDNQTLRELYNGSDVFVMPNIQVKGDREGFGRVVLEAALCQLPVVASGIEGITDAIIDNQNGRLVKEKDVAGFLKQLTYFLENKQRAERFGKSARQFTLDNYNWDKIANQYLDEYAKLLS